MFIQFLIATLIVILGIKIWNWYWDWNIKRQCRRLEKHLDKLGLAEDKDMNKLMKMIYELIEEIRNE